MSETKLSKLIVTKVISVDRDWVCTTRGVYPSIQIRTPTTTHVYTSHTSPSTHHPAPSTQHTTYPTPKSNKKILTGDSNPSCTSYPRSSVNHHPLLTTISKIDTVEKHSRTVGEAGTCAAVSKRTQPATQGVGFFCSGYDSGLGIRDTVLERTSMCRSLHHAYE